MFLNIFENDIFYLISLKNIYESHWIRYSKICTAKGKLSYSILMFYGKIKLKKQIGGCLEIYNGQVLILRSTWKTIVTGKVKHKKISKTKRHIFVSIDSERLWPQIVVK